MSFLIVCDLDGTLADCRHRQHLAGQWDEFHKTMNEDKLFVHVDMVLRNLLEHEHDSKLIFLTGRPEEHRQVTHDWLLEVAGYVQDDDYEELLMRPKDDYRSDVELKPQLFNQWLMSNGYNLSVGEILMFDDRDRVVTMWRDLGYTCFQTAEGAF